MLIDVVVKCVLRHVIHHYESRTFFHSNIHRMIFEDGLMVEISHGFEYFLEVQDMLFLNLAHFNGELLASLAVHTLVDPGIGALA
jgi:hypothetical protein